MVDDAFGDTEVVLPERARRIVHSRAAKMLDHAGRPAYLLPRITQDGVRVLTIAVPPQAMQLSAQPLADQVEAGCEGLCTLTVAHQHHLRRLRAAFHDDLQIARETGMRG